jgi:Domain of unknown function (DUF4188)
MSFIKFIENPIISSNFRTTTWIIVGALLFQVLASILTTRITFFLSFLALLSRLIPTLLTAAGKLPNEQLSSVMPGRTTAMFPASDGSKSINPSGKGLALLILGVKITHPLGFLAPGAKQTGDYFTSMVKELNANPSEHGWIGGSTVQGVPTSSSSSGHITLIGYFKTIDDLHRFAHGSIHRETWNWWNANVKAMPHIGVYHEAYDVPSKSWEAIYVQTPKLGLGAGKVEIADGQWENMLIAAKKGVWKSSEGRMGRSEKWGKDERVEHDY